jgi:hypothetical protein
VLISEDSCHAARVICALVAGREAEARFLHPPSRAGHPVVVPISRRAVTIAPPVASTTA